MRSQRSRRRACPAAFAAALAAVAVNAGTAGALPEVGRCVPQVGGRYMNARCTFKGKGGSFEWQKNAVKTGFTAQGGEAILETSSGLEIRCGIGGQTTATGAYHAKGVIPSTKEVVGVVMRLRFCTLPLLDVPCQTEGAAAYEIVTAPMKGVLAYTSGKGTSSPVINQSLRPEAAKGLVAEVACPGISVTFRIGEGTGKLHDTILADIGPPNVMSSTLTEEPVGSKGIQTPEHIEGKTLVDGWEAEYNGGPYERMSLEVGSGLTITNEEPLEIKA